MLAFFLVYIVGSTCKFSLVRDLSKYICTKLTGCTKEVSNAVVICVRFRVVFLFFCLFLSLHGQNFRVVSIIDNVMWFSDGTIVA